MTKCELCGGTEQHHKDCIYGAEEWNEGLVRFTIIDHRGRSTHQEQMCWNKDKFIDRMVNEALKSQSESDEAKRFGFVVR